MEQYVEYIKALSLDGADWRVLEDSCRRQERHDLAKQFYDVVVSDHQNSTL